MAKSKVGFVCNECGADYSKWQGQCTECGAWNSVQQITLGSAKNQGRARNAGGYAGTTTAVKKLNAVDMQQLPRIDTGMQELNRVLGGGLVPGSAILIGGHPGAGKSTLLLQTICELSRTRKALYVTGEESLQQVAMRAQRLNLPTDHLDMLAETQVEVILDLLREHQPQLVVIDSIQVMHLDEIESAAGSVSQVRECAAALTRYAKQTETVLLFVGHVTKDGSLAGPKVLEHMIDCSILLEGSEDSRFRTLRGQKNRFGAVNEIGVFAMLEQGLKEVKNPSSIFLNRTKAQTPGSIVTVIWEGTRPLLVEIQALVDESHGAQPRRVAVGLDYNRLNMLLAVLNRHGGLHLGDQDVFLNVVGGLKVMETSADLAAVIAAVSSFRNLPLPHDLVILGEVGLSGEIRPVPSGQERIYEAAKHGFKRAIVPAANKPRKSIENMTVQPVETIAQVLDLILSS